MTVVVWYGVCLAAILVGRAVAQWLLQQVLEESVARPAGKAALGDARRSLLPGPAYQLLTAVAAVGVVYAYVKAGGSVSIISVLKSDQANQLKEAIPQSTGVQTLRYAAPLAAAVGVHDAVLYRRFDVWLAVNVVLLAGVALISSRLALILTVVACAYLIVGSVPELRIRVIPAISVLVVVGLALIPLSYVRTADTYKAAGISSPVTVMADQVRSYLAAPTQVALGVADTAAYGNFSPVQSGPVSGLSNLAPTFLQSKSDQASSVPGGVTSEPYSNYVSVSSSLTTNSVFATVYAGFGVWGLLAALFGLFVGAVLYTYFESRGRGYSLGAAVLLYGFAETWRIFMFNQGILWFMIVLAVVVGTITERIERAALVSANSTP